MKTKKLTMDRQFYIRVHNALQNGKSYSDLTKELDIPVNKAYPAFNQVEQSVKKSPKLYFECLVYQKSRNDILAEKIIEVLQKNNINTVRDLKPLANLDYKSQQNIVDEMTKDIRSKEVIFNLIRYVKGA